MQVNNDISKQSFKGTFYFNGHLKSALKNAGGADKVAFVNVLNQMEKVDDGKIFELGMKKSNLCLLCTEKLLDVKSVDIHKVKFFKLNDKIFEKETFENFYKGMLESVNEILRKFYPKVYVEKQKDEIIDSYDVLPFEIDAEPETEPIIPKIHEDLLPFEDNYRMDELFNRKEDIIEQDFVPYSIDDVELRPDLMPEASNIEYLNGISNSPDFGEFLIDEKPKIKQPKNKVEKLPDNFPAFALDYVREFSLKEAATIYEILKKIGVQDYREYINASRDLFRKFGISRTIECINKAILTERGTGSHTNNRYEPKLFDFLIKYPYERAAVVTINYLGVEIFDDYGAQFYEELDERLKDKNEIKRIHEDCKYFTPYGTAIISRQKAVKALSELGFYFSSKDKKQVENMLLGKISDNEIESICNNIKENKVENFGEYVNAIESHLSAMDLKEATEFINKALVKYNNKRGETIGVFNKGLMTFLKRYPNYRELVVTKDAAGNEIFDEQKPKIFMQMQRIFGNTDEAYKAYQNCLSIEKSGENKDALVVNTRGKILAELLEDDFSYNEAVMISEIAKDFKRGDILDILQKCKQYHKTMKFEKMYSFVTQSLITRVGKNGETEKNIFEPELMDFLIKYPDDRELVVSEDLYGNEKFEKTKARRIMTLRRQAERTSSWGYYRETRETERNPHHKYEKVEYDTQEADEIFEEGMKTFEEGMKTFEESMKVFDTEKNVYEEVSPSNLEKNQNNLRKKENEFRKSKTSSDVESYKSMEELISKHGNVKPDEKMSMTMINGVIKEIVITKK